MCGSPQQPGAGVVRQLNGCAVHFRATQANFILNKVVGRSAVGVAKGLRAKGVLVRFFGSQGGDLHKYIRISAGRPSDTDRLMTVLREMQPQEGFPSLPGLPLPASICLF